MSLDIYLIENFEKELLEWNERRNNSIKEAGDMIGLIPIIEEYYKNRKPKPEVVYESNITHNLYKMADVAGIYKSLWRPEEIGITKAEQLIDPLKEGLERLKKFPEVFKKYDAPNGWGRYIDFVPWVEEYLNACITNPEAEVQVSR